MSEGCQSVRNPRMVYLAFYYWFPHVTIIDPKAIIDGMEWNYDQAAQDYYKEAQNHTDCQPGNP